MIGEHDELGERTGKHEELYFVASGRATFTIDGDEVDAPAGTFIFVQPEAKRKAVSEEPETTILVVGGRPGEPFETSAWERSGPAFAYWATGEFDKAIAFLSQALEQYPGDAGVLYNLACAESLAGDTEAALGHLRSAVEADHEFAALADGDSDFNPVRDRPEFSAITRKPDAGSSGS